MARYRTSTLELTAPGRPEIVTAWSGQTMGGRVPAFMALAQKNGGGVYFENPPTLADGIKGTDLDFEVRLEAMQAVVQQDTIDGPVALPVDVPRFRAAVAHYNDGRTPVVFSTWQSPRYVPIQTTDALAWGESLSGAQLAAIGAYGDPVGCKVYAAYDLGGFQVGGKDEHEAYLTITTTHDGTGSASARVVPIRFDCTNQSDFYFGKQAPAIKIRHTANAQENMAMAQQAVEASREYLGLYVKKMDELLKVRHTEDDFITWTREMTGVKDVPKGAAQVREDALTELLAGDTCAFGRGTAYASLNAWTEYLDHVAPVRGEDPVAARANRIVLGRVEAAKQDGLDRLLALV